jgi:hypothetical protein
MMVTREYFQLLVQLNPHIRGFDSRSNVNRDLVANDDKIV